MAVSLFGCSSPKVRDYQNEKPILKLETFLNGSLDAYGIFQDRSGQVKKRFHCVMLASWSNGVGTIDETFTYSDGTTSKRIWTLKKSGENFYTGTAADVVGEAVGETSGNAFHWRYVLDLEVDGSHYQVKLDDWMYLVDEKIIINRTKMSKFGFHLGDLTLTMVKR